MLIEDYDIVSAWVAEHTDCEIPKVGATIGWVKDGRIVCGVLYEQFTGTSITTTIAIAEGTIVPRGFLRAIFDYPFNKLGVKKLLGIVEQSNKKAIQFDEWLGFEREARIEDMFPSGAGIIYTMTKDNCRWLENYDG